MCRSIGFGSEESILLHGNVRRFRSEGVPRSLVVRSAQDSGKTSSVFSQVMPCQTDMTFCLHGGIGIRMKAVDFKTR